MRGLPPDWISGIARNIPFLCMLTIDPEHQPGTKNLIMKLLEAGIVGAVILYGTVEVLGVRMEHIEQAHAELKMDVKDNAKEVRDELKEIRKSLSGVLWKLVEHSDDKDN